MVDASWVSHEKAEMGGGRFFCQLNQSCLKLHEMDRSSLRSFLLFCHKGGALLLAEPKLLEIA